MHDIVSLFDGMILQQFLCLIQTALRPGRDCQPDIVVCERLCDHLAHAACADDQYDFVLYIEELRYLCSGDHGIHAYSPLWIIETNVPQGDLLCKNPHRIGFTKAGTPI